MKSKIIILLAFITVIQICYHKVYGSMTILNFSDNWCLGKYHTVNSVESFQKTETANRVIIFLNNYSGNKTICYPPDIINCINSVHDLTGNYVSKSLQQREGEHSMLVQLKSAAKRIYIVRLSAPSNTITKKII